MSRAWIASAGLVTTLVAIACSDGPDGAKYPPKLLVTAPERSHRIEGAGRITVEGKALRNEDSDASIDWVSVNGARAQLDDDGSFRADIEVPLGALLIHTIAHDSSDTEATDTRSVQAGQLRPVGTSVEDGVMASISKPGFAKLGTAAGRLLETGDIAKLLMPFQPLIHRGD
jgi:hypothetical protein